MTDDLELLRRYAEQRAQEAFAELVQRHCGFVYHAALRQLCGDDHAARDVAQHVFADLARKAGQISLQSSIIGWLHTATRFAAGQIRRTEARRRERELAAHALDPETTDPAATADWEKLRPEIDDAIGTLNDHDREAVLMRFFEDRPFAEIGDRFFTSEDAARVRVNRALEKLRPLLVQRGTTSTAAALAVALEGQAGLAAPAGLATTVTNAALAGAAGGGLAFLGFMATSKMIAGVAGVIAAVAIGIAVHQRGRLGGLESAAATAQRDAAELRERVQQLQAKVEAESKRAQAADEDNARLIEAMERMAALRRDDATKSAVSGEPVSEAVVDARYRRAVELMHAGRFAEALQEFLWCYDEGMPRFTRFVGVRTSFLTSELGELAKRYPPAREALEARRAQAEGRMRADAAERVAVQEFTALNDALGENDRTLAWFDQLAANDPRRSLAGSRVQLFLIAQQRYAEAVAASGYAQRRGMFELMVSTLGQDDRARAGGSAAARTQARRDLLRETARDVEALAGAGEIQHARELAGRLLEFDSSAETRSLLQEHLARAGQPELLVPTTTVAPAR